MKTEENECKSNILFYAWTDTQIINAVNTRANIFHGVNADLLIFNLKRISKELTHKVIEQKVFGKVFILEVPDFYLERKRKGAREKIRALFLGKMIRNYFISAVGDLLDGREYSTFLTASFWSESLLIIRYLKLINSKLEILFYEDGLADYNGPSKWLFNAVPNQSIKAKVRTLLYYGFTSFTYRKDVKGIYLYEPLLSNISYLPLYKIPAITELGNRESYRICKSIKKTISDIYEQNKIIYIVDAPVIRKREPMGSTYRIMDALCETVPDEKVIVKLHPLMESLQIDFIREKYSKVYVDATSERVEEYLLDKNLDKYIFVVENSSSVFYLKHVYEKNPYILLISNKESRRVKKFKNRFADGDNKILIVKNAYEIAAALKKWGLILTNQ